ncbi:dynein light chain Tctex-type protein 2B [Xenopus laevis]|nr:dynein light chain Tctex-type protein 2B [Xenopus laevis]
MGESESGENTYCIRLNFQHKFKSASVKDCIRSVLKEELSDKQYVPEDVPQLTRFLSETVKDKLKDIGFDRYKMVVQVVIGEQRGEGAK